MASVLLRLSAPMQSYGLRSRWEEHATAPRPTKSAVVGLIANALGRELNEDVSDLAAMVFAVRADRPGRIILDQQTAGGGRFPLTPLTGSRPKTDGNGRWYGAPRRPEIAVTGAVTASHHPTFRDPVLISKYYLADAAFLSGLTTDDDGLAHRILQALRQPARLLFLGRRSCPPAYRVGHGITALGADLWPDGIPLLPEATDPHPQVWTEAPPGAGRPPSPEAVPTTFADRDHRLLHLAVTRATPPNSTEEQR